MGWWRAMLVGGMVAVAGMGACAEASAEGEADVPAVHAGEGGEGDGGGALRWEGLPDLPEAEGVAGPFVGVHGDALIVAGGANFPVEPGEDRWEVDKAWHDAVWVLTRDGGRDAGYTWREGFSLPRPIGYGAAASTRFGVVCLGGEDGERVYDDVFLLRWNAGGAEGEGELEIEELPPLPRPMAFGAAAVIGDVVYVAGGQSGLGLDTAMTNFWRLDLSKMAGPAEAFAWEPLPPWPGEGRAFNIVVAQHNGFEECIYLIGGRRANEDADAESDIVPLADVYEFRPSRYDPAAFDVAGDTYHGSGRHAEPWRRRADLPRPNMAGTAIAVGQAHVFVLTGDAGELWTQTDTLRDDHPGFDRRSWAYHTITDTWIDAGPTPANPVTTPAVAWGDAYVIASGETRPRHRTAAVWRIDVQRSTAAFGAVNFTVLVVYLLGVVGLGVYFATRHRDTDDYFRGGQRVPWLIAGLSIYATMLSSITYMAIPAKAFAEDWVFLLGNCMILAVAPIAVYVALPFFRRIDATSAYEYLHKRFNRTARLFGSGSFTVFHVFRMAIVMSLAGLALATVTPLTPTQCVLLIGLLSVLYCTLGGIEAVVWTDSVQSVVLLAGAVFCVVLMLGGVDGTVGDAVATAWADDKFRMVNFHWDATSAHLALWVVVLGALGQNVASYTSDQAVVQRYTTTPDRTRAAKAIWTNALLAIPGSVLFFAMGAGLYVFYKGQPDKLDPTFNIDQVLPLFIMHELPVGVAGLVVAGIFAAAQSTISTSMNSTATTVVTDFLRPLNLLRSERAYLNTARGLTLALGCGGTLLGVMFVDPGIRSLWDQFIAVIGLFMGVLGGLFCLGMFTTRANGPGAVVGAIAGALTMVLVWQFTALQGYLYAFVGIGACFVTGYAASLMIRAAPPSVAGLTIYSLRGDLADAEAETVQTS